MIIGITGRAGSGKDTFARMLVEEFEKKGRHARCAAFATPIKEAVIAMVGGITMADLEDREKKDRYHVSKKSLRQIMQDVGLYGRSIHPMFWIDRLFAQWGWVHDEDDVLIITDVRFDNEAETILKQAGETLVVEIIRKDAGLCGKAGEHVSEAGIRDTLASNVYTNNGTMEELAIKAKLLVNVLT